MKISNKQRKMLGLGAILMGTSAFAADANAGFDSFYTVVKGWVGGSLGYIIALLGMVGTLVVYAFTHKGSVIFIGTLIAFFAGALVGLSQVMFDAGTGTFQAAQP